jgi:hypothetical protein
VLTGAVNRCLLTIVRGAAPIMDLGTDARRWISLILFFVASGFLAATIDER